MNRYLSNKFSQQFFLTIIFSLPFNAFSSDPVFLQCESEFEKTICNTTKALLELRHNDQPYWVGAFEPDPVTDAIFLVFAKKLGRLSDPILKESLDRIFLWPGRNENGWPGYPGGAVDFNSTGIILLSLKELGLGERPELQGPWRWFRKNGGIKNLSTPARLQLTPLGLLGKQGLPLATVKVAALPKGFPFNAYALGVTRGLFVPFLAWGYYSTISSTSPESKASLKKRGGALGIPHRGIGNEEDTSELDSERAAEENENRKGGEKTETLNGVVDAVVPGSEDFWARETLGWILRTQQKNGSWYVFINTTFSMLALHEAQKKGVADFSKEIEAGWQSLLSLRTKNPNNLVIQQQIFSSVWDTANSLNAIYKVPSSLVKFPKNYFDESLRWLVGAQVKNPPTWSEIMDVQAGGWSFDHNDSLYPDNDDTSAALHALLEAPKRGNRKSISAALDFVLEHQNRDGGFPAWDTNMSRTPFKLMAGIFDDFPDVADLSQADVTSRVIFVLNLVKDREDLSEYHSAVDDSIRLACDFLESTSQVGPEGTPPIWKGDWVVNYGYGTASVVGSLLKVGCWDSEKSWPSIKWILSKQNSDGGWGEHPDSYQKMTYVPDRSSIFQTNAALFGLINFYEKDKKTKWIKQRVERAIQKGFRYLMTNTRNGTFFDDSFNAVLVKGYSYSRYLHVPYYSTLYTFSHWYELRKSEGKSP